MKDNQPGLRADIEALFAIEEGQTARKGVYAVRGERDGRLFLEPALAAGGRIVTEGRSLLQDGDLVGFVPEIARTDDPIDR